MSQLWSDRSRFLRWLEVEHAVSAEFARKRVIPPADWKRLDRALKKLHESGGVDPIRVEKHEQTTRHDVIAFTTAVAERIGAVSRYVHFGLTSSDVVDTALSITIQKAGEILRGDLDRLLKTLAHRAREARGIPAIGRTHGMYAEPTSFGLKFLGWYSEIERNRERLERALEGLRVGKLSGAVGSAAHISPEVEAKILRRLGLQREAVSTQVLPRDRHAELLQVLALTGAGLERIAVELRHLQRSEVSEVMEGFAKGQKGSSAMPHKRNPISSENITGCARLLRGYAQAELESVALWHERDISHSSVERVALADAMILADYALARMNSVLENLVLRKDRIAKNLADAGPTVFSGHVLLALVQTGATREDAYRWVQQCAHAHLEGEGEFMRNLEKHPEISRRLSREQIRRAVSVEHQLRHVRDIYRSVLGRA